MDVPFVANTAGSRALSRLFYAKNILSLEDQG